MLIDTFLTEEKRKLTLLNFFSAYIESSWYRNSILSDLFTRRRQSFYLDLARNMVVLANAFEIYKMANSLEELSSSI